MRKAYQRFLGFIGDVSPEYDTAYVYHQKSSEDCIVIRGYETGKRNKNYDDEMRFQVYRFCLDVGEKDWFDLDSVASCVGSTREELVKLLNSDNPVDRARAYVDIGSFHGFENFDSYPLDLSEAEMVRRFRRFAKLAKERVHGW